MCNKNAENLSDPVALSILFNALPEELNRVYSGAHGCACGCRGNYNETPRQIKATLRKMQRLALDGGARAWMSWNKGEKNPRRGTPAFVVVETENRTHCAYFA